MKRREKKKEMKTKHIHTYRDEQRVFKKMSKIDRVILIISNTYTYAFIRTFTTYSKFEGIHTHTHT